MPVLPSLSVQPRRRHFARRQEAALARALDEAVRDTLIDEVSGLADVQLAPDGTLAGGYRYTSTALRQVANLVGPGLYPLVVDLSGSVRDPERPREDYSFELARRTFNRMVELRLNRLVGTHRLIRDTRGKTIDGVLGPRYSPIDNAEIFAQTKAAAASSVFPSIFLEAELTGRRLMLRFVHDHALFGILGDAGPIGYQTGLHVANSEVGGESTVRAATILRRMDDGTTSMGRFLGGRRVHSGTGLARRVAMVFGEVAAHEPVACKLEARILALRAKTLGLGFDLDADRQARVRELADRLAVRGVPKRSALQAVTAAMYCGDSGHGVSMPMLLSRTALEGRTAFDLYCALTAQAAALYATSREAVEQAAYNLLQGRISLQ
jgi:hypothetical protein